MLAYDGTITEQFPGDSMAQLEAAVDHVVANGVLNLQLRVATRSVGHVEWRGSLTSKTHVRVFAILRPTGGTELRVEDDREWLKITLCCIAIGGIPVTAGFSIVMAIAAWFLATRWARKKVIGGFVEKVRGHMSSMQLGRGVPAFHGANVQDSPPSLSRS